MGEHLIDESAPELHAGEFTNTRIWDVAGGVGVDRQPIAQPRVYARSGASPTASLVRDVPAGDAIAVEIRDFQQFEGAD